MAALRHMTDSDLRALGIPMVGALHLRSFSLFSDYELAHKIGKLLAPHIPLLKGSDNIPS